MAALPLRRLPSLNALRAFEAAARLQSFKAAADELSVTPGAISQQIRSLEEDLGVALFTRVARAVELTRDGEYLLSEISGSFQRIHQAIDHISVRGKRILKLNASAAMITKFLLPRLQRFTSRHPDIEVSIETQFDLNPMEPGGPDVTIRLTRTPPDNLYAKLLFEELLLPVASPALVKGLELRRPQDILRAPLLHDVSLAIFDNTPAWQDWFQMAGIDAPVPGSTMRFERRAADYVVDAAISGQGMMLGRSSLCHTALTTGQLTCPFGPVLNPGVGVYLLCRHEVKSQPSVRAFIEWMQGEAALVSTLRALHDAN